MTDKERKDLLKDAPDFVQLAEPYLQMKYLDYEMARQNLDNCPDRYFICTNDQGANVRVDLKSPNVKGLLANKGCSKEDIDDALEIKKEIITPLTIRCNEAYKTYCAAFDLSNSKKGAKDSSLAPLLLDLFGSYNSITDVQKVCRKRHGYIMSEGELKTFYNKNRHLIEQRRTKYTIESKNYKVATEAGRLEMLNDMLTDFKIKYDNFIELNKDKDAVAMSREIRAILEQARKEVKGNELKLTVDGRIDINATLHGKENISRIMRDIPINSLVVGMVAAKQGMNPVILMSQLSSSYYKDFNGFGSNILDSNDVVLPGELIKSANWDDLREKNKAFLSEMKSKPEYEYTDFEEQSAAERNREKLLERIKALKERQSSIED